MTEKDNDDFNVPGMNLELIPYLVLISLVSEMLILSYKFVGPHARTLQKSLLGILLALFCACKRHFYINAFNRHDKGSR